MKHVVVAVGLVLIASGRPGLANVPQGAPCQAPAPPASKQPNIFSETQENDLGDAVAEGTARDVRVIDNDALTADLSRIGDRLVRHLPPTNLNIRFSLVDLPDANAFVLPGGRVYVSRKLIGFTQDEDELAGVLGHELGHLIARQQTLRFTRLLREVIGVTSVTDRRDIFDKYNQLMDNAARKPRAFEMNEGREDGDQLEADRIGLYVVAAAGYDPQAHIRLWDRYAETRGKTGGFFSNLFGATSPESRRLRELMKGAATLPPACIEARSAVDRAAYQGWQAAVIGFTGAARKEQLTNVLSRTTLEPPLRGEVEHLRFSPDGRFVLAQDDGGITVLSREPFAPVFHIDAADADEPQFSPDSASVVFKTSDLRVERWSLADKKLVEVHEVVVRSGCLLSQLAPDGRTLGCLDGDFNLDLIDVGTGSLTFQQKKFFGDNYVTGVLAALLAISRVHLAFSSDGRFFAAAYDSFSRQAATIYDQTAKAPLTLRGDTKKMMTGGFVFTAPDTLLAHNSDDDAKSVQIALPKAEITGPIKLFPGEATAATRGNFVLLRPFQKYGVGVMDLARGAVVKGNPNKALDIHDRVFVAERISGELAIYNMADNTVLSTATLPRSTLGTIQGVAISPDFKWLAVSGRTRGAVWDLANGARVIHIRGFNGGFFDERAQLYADFPKNADEPRKLGRIDMQQRQVAGLGELKDRNTEQVGPILLTRTVAERGNGATLEVRDVQSATPAWNKTFTSEVPRVFPSDRSGTIVFVWPANSDTARNECRKVPALWKQLNALKSTQGDYFLQVADAKTGTLKGALVIETGNASFRVEDVVSVDDWVAMTVGGNRVLLYSLSTGEQKGHVFGDRATIAPGSGLLKVGNGAGRVAIYDLTTMERRRDFTFVHDVALTRFSLDGSKLFVLTEDQTAFTIDISKK
jgi:hypothetical protein